MIEIPESATIARQITETLKGRTVTGVFNATYLHKFTWFAGLDPAEYPALLTGRTIQGAEGHGAYIDLIFDDDIHLILSDGVHLRYHAPGEPVPSKYQLLLTLDNEGFLVCTVGMYGGIQAFRGTLDNPYYLGALEKPSPLTERFDEDYFARLLSDTKENASTKAFLATEQRIPGLGNGVLQDILFEAGIHPKRKIGTLNEADRKTLYKTVKSLLKAMTDLGGRDTDKDLFDRAGGYRVKLSKNTWREPCPVCGGSIGKEAYLGGAIYYCKNCQK